MPMMPRKKNSQARSAEDCFLFEESLRNYKAVVVNHNPETVSTDYCNAGVASILGKIVGDFWAEIDGVV